MRLSEVRLRETPRLMAVQPHLCRAYSDIFMQPFRHARIIHRARVDLFPFLIPCVLVSFEELLAMALVLREPVSLESILVPVVVLLAVAFPLVSGVDRWHYRSLFLIMAKTYALSSPGLSQEQAAIILSGMHLFNHLKHS